MKVHLPIPTYFHLYHCICFPSILICLIKHIIIINQRDQSFLGTDRARSGVCRESREDQPCERAARKVAQFQPQHGPRDTSGWKLRLQEQAETISYCSASSQIKSTVAAPNKIRTTDLSPNDDTELRS